MELPFFCNKCIFNVEQCSIFHPWPTKSSRSYITQIEKKNSRPDIKIWFLSKNDILELKSFKKKLAKLRNFSYTQEKIKRNKQ